MTDPISPSATATRTGPERRESLGICANQLTMTVLMTPDMANFVGNVHGGSILKLLDQVAYACAARYAGGYVMTLSVDQVIFLQPVHVGELLTLLANVNYTGRTSMEVGIKVLAEEIHSGLIRHTNSCFFTMVAVDAEGHSVPVRPLQPQTEEEQRRFRAATERRTLRAEIARRLAGTHR
jgi:acyl-CoA hydrolase